MCKQTINLECYKIQDSGILEDNVLCPKMISFLFTSVTSSGRLAITKPVKFEQNTVKTYLYWGKTQKSLPRVWEVLKMAF